jgi:hypothetical protein
MDAHSNSTRAARSAAIMAARLGGVASLAAIALLAGCGKSDAPASAAVKAAEHAKAAVNQDASAQEVARAARGDLDCPAKLTAPPRAANAPVDDVVGVRPGLSFDEASRVVACTNDLLVVTPEVGRGFQIQTYGQTLRQGFTARFAEPHVVKTGKQIVQEMEREATARGMNAVRQDLKPGQAKWFVGTMGLPGQERVLSAARQERFAADASPTSESVRQALLKKYGTPTQQRTDPSHWVFISWAYDPLGRLITETSPLYNRCSGSVDPDAGVNLTPDCGIVVAAQIAPQRANPDLVDKLSVGVVDGAGGYKLIADTEQGLQRMDQQRRGDEVRKAAKDAKGPTL